MLVNRTKSRSGRQEGRSVPTTILPGLVAGLVCLVLLAACGAPGKPGDATPHGKTASQVRPADRFSWLSGHFASETTSETWIDLGKAVAGVGMGVRGSQTAFFEVLILQEIAGTWTYTALPNGLHAVDFPAVEIGAMHALFANPEHDFPQRIRYQRDGDRLLTRISGAGRPDSEFALTRQELVASPELEDRDRRFAADSAVRGASAWADIFEAEGAMWTRRSGRTESAAIGDTMARVFAENLALDWEPLASGLSPLGDLGFTIGRYRLLRPNGGGKPTSPAETDARVYETLENGHYVTIWHRQPDGSWQVAFDAGVPDRAL